MDPKENFLRVIHFDNPEYVPHFDEQIVKSIIYKKAAMPPEKGGTDLWGVYFQPDTTSAYEKYTHVCHPAIHPLPDLDQLNDYKFPNPDDFELEDRITMFGEPIESIDRKKHLVFATHVYLLFERACPLMGMDNFLINLKLNPTGVKELLKRITDYNIAIAYHYLEQNVDGVRVTEDLGTQRSLMISPHDWREFFKPELKRFFKVYLDEGKIIIFHSCGHIMPIIEDLMEIGVTILNPIQARANDLSKTRILTDHKMTLNGGIDSHLMMIGTPEDIERETKARLKELATNGGYIASPDQHLPFPPQNVESLIHTVEKHGRYPLSV